MKLLPLLILSSLLVAVASIGFSQAPVSPLSCDRDACSDCLDKLDAVEKRLSKLESYVYLELSKPSQAKQSSTCNCGCNKSPCDCLNCPYKVIKSHSKSQAIKSQSTVRPTITCRGTDTATSDWRSHEMQLLFTKGYDVNFEIDNKFPLRFSYSWKPGEQRGYLFSGDLPDVNTPVVIPTAQSTPTYVEAAPIVQSQPNLIRDSPVYVLPTPTVQQSGTSCYRDSNGNMICPRQKLLKR